MARLACSTAILALALGGTSIYFSWVSTMDLRQAKQELRQVRQEGQDLWKAVKSLSSGTELRRRQLARAPASGGNPDPLAKATPSGAADGDSQLLGLEARVAEIEKAPSAFPRKEDLFQRFSELKGEAKRHALKDIAQLARLGDEQARDLVLGALKDPDESIREKAVKALGDMNDPELLPSLEASMMDSSPLVRDEVAGALAKIADDNKARPLLLKLLEDESSEVVGESIQAITSKGYREALPYMSRLAQSEDLYVATEAGLALRKFGESDGADLVLRRLATGLQSKDPLERLTVVQRLGRIGGEGSVPYLQQALKDESLNVREEAQKLLSEHR